ncbi:MAG: 2-oxoglutarate ferredoxin oxidoreductase subunit alpha [Bacilli bacterium]|nr:2-oxoglutarate ferredoxin oxidoreductase subunit alpha [Bacilli bacterium]
MNKQLTWKVGGAQGEGIDSTGEILATTLNRIGYYIFAYRHFMSLIKGGHTNYKIRISSEPVRYHGDDLQVLVAFDQLSINENLREMNADGVIIYDDKFQAELPEGSAVRLCPVPLTGIAKELGNVIIKNMVAAGASCRLLNLELQPFFEVVEEKFGSKGKDLIERNIKAIQQGYDYMKEHFADEMFQLPTAPQVDRPHLLMTGNEAVGLGALLAGCRFLAAYPITPATEILYWLLENMPNYGGKIVQAEDEIAACIMAIGANYAGVRAMTSTSGPGFSLMMEALGLAGISETPLVIVDVMRGGPSTGLPTKTEQSDINQATYGSHGEMPRIVLAPTTIEECFYYMIDAFNLAERYQCPVIVTSDLYLGMSKQSVDDLDMSRVVIDRGAVVTQEELDQRGQKTYPRYAVTESGISPRPFPGMPHGRFCALSNEHDDTGLEIEDTDGRVAQMDKRFRKLDTFNGGEHVSYKGPEQPDVVLVGFGSTTAQIAEAFAELSSTYSIGHLQIGCVYPFPTEAVRKILAHTKQIFVIENNKTGQLAQMLQQNVGMVDKVEAILKYNGNPFTVRDITTTVRG